MVSRKIKGFLAMVVGLFAVLLLVEEGAQAFQTNTCPSCRQLQKSTTTRRHIVGVETIGIALVSAMAGAATQVPKIQQLEGELLEARGALEQSREELISKIAELEDKLFLMDKAYEDQSAKFMVEYEKKKNEEVEKITDKMKTDFKYKLEIEVEKEKAKLLMKKLSDVSVASDQTTKLAEMKIKMNQLEKAKSKLESALTNSESELKRINESAGKKANSWFF
jgi:hypothetical protein